MREILNLSPRIGGHTINLHFRFTEKLIRITKHSHHLVIISNMIITEAKGSETPWPPIITQRWRFLGDPNGGVPEKHTVSFDGETEQTITRANNPIMAKLVLDRVVKVLTNS